MDRLLRIHMDDKKLWVFGELSTDRHEMYLPGRTEEQIKQFLTEHISHMARVLHEHITNE